MWLFDEIAKKKIYWEFSCTAIYKYKKIKPKSTYELFLNFQLPLDEEMYWN